MKTPTSSRHGRARVFSRIASSLGFLFAAVIQTSCSSDATGTTKVATTISITPNNATIDAFGGTEDFDVTILDQNGDPMEGFSVEWTTLSGSIATVSTSGTVTALANGTTQIRAQSGSLQTNASLTVQQLPHTLTKLTGDNQQAVVGNKLQNDLRVRVRDRLNNPVSGAVINFVLSANGGSLSNFNVNTDGFGDALTQLTFGTVAGVHSVNAEVDGAESVNASFAATALPAAPSALQMVSGDNQSGLVGSVLPQVPTVRLVDIFGNPISGAGVAFSIISGGGQATGASQSTNSLGQASVSSWQLGAAPGPNTLRATSPLVAPLEFSATAQLGPPSIAAIHAGNGQNAIIGTAVATAPAVRITDALGNPIQGFTVTFAATGGGGQVTGATQITDVNGVARVGSWTMGNTPGANQLTATVTPLAAVVFSATATVVPANIAIFAGNNQSVNAGTTVPVKPSVRVTTATGIAAPGVTVSFVIGSGGGSVTGAQAISDANGVATVGNWTLGQVVGANVLQASVQGLNIVMINATGTVGPPANLQIHAGNNQSTATGTAVATDPAVRVTDQFSNPIPDLSVSFVVTAGGGSTTGSPATTNAAGVATLDSWTLGGTQGLNQLRADVATLQSVTFSANATVQPVLMVIHAGGNQSATVGTQVAVPPAVRVTDAGFAPVQGVSVTYTVSSGGGNITGASVVTDANGVAAVGSWTLGTVAGANTITATVASLAPTIISATGTAGVAASIAVHSGNNQTVAAGAQVPIAPTAIVRDAFANPVQGVTVTFDVVSGGGSINSPVSQTSIAGTASVGSWTLGAGAQSLSATATGAGIGGNPALFSATGQVSAFDIDLEFLTAVTQAQQNAFTNAVAKWVSIITGDLPTATLNVGAGDCGTNSPAHNGTIDDLKIYVTLEPIDGVGMVLGSAGPCRIRGGSFLPVTGRMRFDTADLASMEASGILESVILHEMGHVLGIGTIWSMKGFLENPSLPSSPGADTHFDGPNAIAGFNAVGGNVYVSGAKVPVENTQGGSGTRDAHWRESLFGSELMTGFIGAGTSPLSLLTVRSLEDLGYVVNTSAADPFTYTGGAIMMDPGPKVHLMGDVITDPIRPIGG